MVWRRFFFLSLLQKSDSELRILSKSRLHGIHWATLCVLLSWPPDKRTLVLGQCFFQSSFFIFLPHCPAPDKRTYRAHGPAESASSAPASCAYITNPRPVTSALWLFATFHAQKRAKNIRKNEQTTFYLPSPSGAVHLCHPNHSQCNAGAFETSKSRLKT